MTEKLDVIVGIYNILRGEAAGMQFIFAKKNFDIAEADAGSMAEVEDGKQDEVASVVLWDESHLSERLYAFRN